MAIVIAVTLGMFTGRGLLPSASGASIVEVTGMIPADIYLDATACAPASVNIGELIPSDPWKTAQDNTSSTCGVDFGTTNHAPGTTLTMLEDPAAPVSPASAMKCVSGPCTGGAIADFDGGVEPAAGTSAFGAQLLSSGGIATSVWSTAPAVHDVQDAGDNACETAAVGSGLCTFTFGATAGGSTAAGAYEAQARLLVLAR